MAPQPERDVGIDLERKEELILAKQLRACRVSILPKGAAVPEAFQSKPPPSRKEPRHLSMKQAPAKKSCAPSPAAMAAATNPVALRYWNQCLALSNPAVVEEPLDQSTASPHLVPADASCPPWAAPPAPRAPRPCPPAGPSMARSTAGPGRPAGVTDWAAILAEEDGARAPPRVPRPWGSCQVPQVPRPWGASQVPQVPGTWGASQDPQVPGTWGASQVPQVPGTWAASQHRQTTFTSYLEEKNGSLTSQVKVNSIQSPKEQTQSNGSNGQPASAGSLVRNQHPPRPSKGTGITTKQPAAANGVNDDPPAATEQPSAPPCGWRSEAPRRGASTAQGLDTVMLELLKTAQEAEQPGIVKLLICSLSTEDILEVMSSLLAKENLGQIILQAMNQKSRRELIAQFVRDDHVLKNTIIKDQCDSTKEELNIEENMTDMKIVKNGISSRVEDSVNLAANEVKNNNESEKDSKLTEFVTKSITDETDIPEDSSSHDNLSQETIDLTEAGVETYESEIVFNNDSNSSETEIEHEKAKLSEVSDTEVFEDEDDEWEYEWEDGEEDEYMEQEEDDYTVESFAGSFSISVLSK